MNVKKNSPGTKMAAGVALGILGVFNAVMTVVFGWNYLAGAFGDGDALFAQLTGAVYALVIGDVMALVGYLLYTNDTETKTQRRLAFIVMVVCLGFSAMATLVQISQSAIGDEFVPYMPLIETIAVVYMMAVTFGLIAFAAAYALTGAKGKINNEVMDMISDTTTTSLNQAKNRLERVKPTLVKALSEQIFYAAVAELGFDRELRYIETDDDRPQIPTISVPVFGTGGGDNDRPPQTGSSNDLGNE